MNKMTRLALAATTAALTAGSAVAGTVVFSEGFDAGLPAGWQTLNFSDFPSGTGFFQGYSSPAPFFAAHSGAATSYMASSAFIGAQTPSGDPAGAVDGYLISPTLSLERDLVLNFWTRTVANNAWAEYLYVGMLVGNQFTTLVEINPTLTVGAYPEAWTEFSARINRLGAGATGNLVFNYYLPDASQMGNYIGLDTVSLQVPEPAAWLALGSCLIAAGVATSRRRRT